MIDKDEDITLRSNLTVQKRSFIIELVEARYPAKNVVVNNVQRKR